MAQQVFARSPRHRRALPGDRRRLLRQNSLEEPHQEPEVLPHGNSVA